jgi:hypothetical protein
MCTLREKKKTTQVRKVWIAVFNQQQTTKKKNLSIVENMMKQRGERGRGGCRP